MGRKRKTAEPIFKPLDAPVQPLPEVVAQFHGIEIPPIPPPLANYGADEKPRQCIHCASRNTRVNKTRTTGRVTLRHRNCLKCGRNFTTREVAP